MYLKQNFFPLWDHHLPPHPRDYWGEDTRRGKSRHGKSWFSSTSQFSGLKNVHTFIDFLCIWKCANLQYLPIYRIYLNKYGSIADLWALMGKHCQKVVVNPKILHFQKIVPKQCKIILTFNCDNPHCWSFGTFLPHFSNWVFRFMGTSTNPSTICQRAAATGWLLTACAHIFFLCGYTGKLLEPITASVLLPPRNLNVKDFYSTNHLIFCSGDMH